MIVCLVKNVKMPAEIAANRIKKIFWISSDWTVSISKILPFLNSSITLTDSLINPGVNNNKILAIIIIIKPNSKELRTREKNRNMAVSKENMKENNNMAVAKLNNCPTSPRKMRIVADLVRGKKVDQALDIFRFSQKEASRKLEKLLLSRKS